MEKHRLVLASFVLDDGPCLSSNLSQERYYYAIYPDNDMDNKFDGCVSADSMTCYSRNFPFAYYEDNSSFIIHENFFKKVN